MLQKIYQFHQHFKNGLCLNIKLMTILKTILEEILFMGSCSYYISYTFLAIDFFFRIYFFPTKIYSSLCGTIDLFYYYYYHTVIEFSLFLCTGWFDSQFPNAFFSFVQSNYLSFFEYTIDFNRFHFRSHFRKTKFI